MRAKAFFSFLADAARRADSLYLLGDIFDSWAGDDDDSEIARDSREALSALSASGVKIYLQRGNRDFLLGDRFCRETGCEMLPDLHIAECGGRRFLLAHGDLFCNDAAYLRYRSVMQSAAFSAAAGLLPLSWRQGIAAKMRNKSRSRPRNASLSREIVTAALRRFGCGTLIHGHLHRAEKEEWTDGEEHFCRRALPDWENNIGGWLAMNENGDLELKSAAAD